MQEVSVTIDKLVHGGQGIGTLPEGKKALVWNALPGETVSFVPSKKRSSYIEGIAATIKNPSAERETPRDDLYLSTSPWQMMTYAAENKYKQQILVETLERGGVKYNFNATIPFEHPLKEWGYRNKMEYSFWGDDDGLHLALYNRGTHLKQRVFGSSIADPAIDDTARAIRDVLAEANTRAGDLKSLIIRSDANGECVAALFTRNENLGSLPFDGICKGVVVYFSNPRSPASVMTRELHTYGDITLTDDILGKPIKYDVISFFQVNLEAYHLALNAIKPFVAGKGVTDMYSGTGSIGLTVSDTPPRLVELDRNTVRMAHINAEGTGAEVIEAAAEKATQYIPCGESEVVILDPPRAGLHADVTTALLATLPGSIVYLSCNPATLARDVALLQESYVIESISGYNFFPRTPHIEALVLLTLK